jgi:hypothetical protein
MTANAYGREGPWSDRPGFDQNGQVASEFGVEEGGEGPPKFSPVFYLADFAVSVDRGRILPPQALACEKRLVGGGTGLWATLVPCLATSLFESRA